MVEIVLPMRLKIFLKIQKKELIRLFSFYKKIGIKVKFSKFMVTAFKSSASSLEKCI